MTTLPPIAGGREDHSHPLAVPFGGHNLQFQIEGLAVLDGLAKNGLYFQSPLSMEEAEKKKAMLVSADGLTS
ncbi:hypothetical protein ACFS07_30055 [Undibacterium arcticum]